ncbi:MAG: hypothetical protein JSV65_12440, partial [Armatimonadota bacterium]
EPFAPGKLVDRTTFGVQVGDASEDTLTALRELGVGSVRLQARWGDVSQTTQAVTALRGAGYDVLVRLSQPKDAWDDLEAWRAYVRRAFEAMRDEASCFEIGAAPNRIKWAGYETYHDYAAAARVAGAVARDIGVHTAGPATQDFEPYWTAAALADFAGFDVLSDHLYTDRSGEPENAEEGVFDIVNKMRLFRALAQVYGQREFWSTQFNWILDVPGGEQWAARSSLVDEERQADYLVRYYVLGLSSGFVERMYWFVLRGRLTGLLDDDGSERPAFEAYRHMTRQLAGATFRGRMESPPWVYLMSFDKGGRRLVVAWTRDGKRHRARLPALLVRDRDGAIVAGRRDELEVGPSPIYVTLGAPACRER